LTDRTTLENAVRYISERINQHPAVAVVLGSGLGDFANQVDDPVEIPASSIPSYPTSTVEGHEGKLIFGRLKGKLEQSLPLVIFKGRVHFYETGNLDSAVFPVVVSKALGARYLIATNAAGGINPAFSEGDLMLIEDFINLSFLNPHKHISPNDATLFHLKANPYFDRQLSMTIQKTATDLGIRLQRGSYCWLKGPSYETRAEIEMLRRAGADAVGMSTVPEIVVGSELGIRTAAVSLISNLATGLTEERLSHSDVAETANRVKDTFISLLRESILRITD
jgi:purine-nucleoside phosphorylase